MRKKVFFILVFICVSKRSSGESNLIARFILFGWMFSALTFWTDDFLLFLDEKIHRKSSVIISGPV